VKTSILLNGEGRMPELRYATRGEVTKVAALPAGMESGATSVGMAIQIKGVGYVFAEMSLAHFQLAAAAFTACYGDQTEGVWIASDQTPKERQ
jgi:hypothetical protein